MHWISAFGLAVAAFLASSAVQADEQTMRDRCRRVDANWSTSHSFSHGASIVTCVSGEVVLGTACRTAKGQCGTSGAFDGPYSYACILSAPKDCADSVRAEAMCCQ